MHAASLVSTKQAMLLARRKSASRRRRSLFAFLFAVLLVGFFILIRQPFLRIHTVVVSGSTLVSTDEVKRYVEQKISGYRYFIFPKNSILLMDKVRLQDEIKSAFPRLSAVSVVKSRRMNIAISEPIFQSMYCALSPEDGVPTSCVLLHYDGRAGSIAPIFSYSPFFTFYNTAYQSPTLGSRVLSTDEIARINAIKDQVVSYGLPVAGIIYGTEQDEILISTGEEFDLLPRIKILPGSTKEKIQETLGAALKDQTIKKLLLEKLHELSYIDLRWGGQVVYKKRTE